MAGKAGDKATAGKPVAGKAGGRTGTSAAAGNGAEAAPTPAQAAFPGVDVDLAHGGGIGDFTSGRDDLLSAAVPATLLPDSEEAFYARDPFSADYADFLKDKADMRRDKAPRVDAELRADLLVKPHLMAKPEESTHRGAAAVWRSLRDQLKNESLAILDRSDPEELLMLQRELRARQMVLESVSKGVDGLLKRVEQRLTDLPLPETVSETAPETAPETPPETPPAMPAPPAKD